MVGNPQENFELITLGTRNTSNSFDVHGAVYFYAQEAVREQSVIRYLRDI